MASGGMILAADMAGSLIDNAQEAAFEVYADESELNAIPAIFMVRPIEEMNHGLYHVDNLTVTDSILEEREPGEALTVGSEGERRYCVHKRRFFEKSYIIPDELVKYASLGGSRGADGLMGWVRERAAVFAQGRFWAEQKHAASLFNYGGYTAGHAVFDNSLPGVIADPGGLQMFDGVELFNQSGATRTALSGSTYHNTLAIAFSATNLETLVDRVQDTNGYSELGERFNNMVDTLVVPLALKSNAEQVIRADKLAGTGNNDANPWARLQMVVWPFLTDTDAWFVGKGRKGLTWWQGGAPDIKLIDEDRRCKVSMQVEFGAQATEWRHWGASNVSSS